MPKEPKYSDEFKAETCRKALFHLSNGKTLTSFAKANKLPFSTVWDWLEGQKTADFSPRALALERGTHALVQECQDISDDETLDPQQKKVRIDTRLRIAGLFNRREFGDQPQTQVNILNQLDFSQLSDAAYGELKAKVLPQLPPPSSDT